MNEAPTTWANLGGRVREISCGAIYGLVHGYKNAWPPPDKARYEAYRAWQQALEWWVVSCIEGRRVTSGRYTLGRSPNTDSYFYLYTPPEETGMPRKIMLYHTVDAGVAAEMADVRKWYVSLDNFLEYALPDCDSKRHAREALEVSLMRAIQALAVEKGEPVDIFGASSEEEAVSEGLDA